MSRGALLQSLEATREVDVVILGGGINGACLYDSLCRQGYRVLLVDKGDFSSGTSQSSGMMIWGGLLYLRNLDFASVFKLSGDRDRIIDRRPEWVKPEAMRYIPTIGVGRAKLWVQSILWLYWLMGMGRRATPGWQTSFSEMELMKPGFAEGSLRYEEAVVDQSDARFVHQWLAPHRQPGQLAVNYCRMTGEYNAADKQWHLNLKDQIGGGEYAARAKLIVNCAGVWTDEVNAAFGIMTEFRHAFSKGVYLGLPRAPQHRSPLFFDLGEHNDVISLLPWGPISLWGPTETAITNLADGMAATNDDVDFLLAQYARRFRVPVSSRQDIVSIRCGVRPLVVGKNYQGDRYPLDLSRREEVILDSRRPWISCYGGKLTGCTRMAARVSAVIGKTIASAGQAPSSEELPPPAATETTFPGLTSPVVSPAWAVSNESCCTLEDYLRRRTNIAQWVPRAGLGEDDCNAAVLKGIACAIAGDAAGAEQMFENYRRKVMNEFDCLVAGHADRQA